MAKAPTKPAAKTGKEMATWDEELARQADIAAGMEEGSASGQFFSVQGGQLSFNGTPLAGNQMAVIIADAVLENVFYEGAYDPSNPAPPTCFAFGKEESDMAPHKVSVESGFAQCDNCKDCAHNEWGSADKGRGKACRNTRRLALLPAGKFNQNGKFEPYTDVEHFETAQLAYLKLPVTSVKGYAMFVKQVAGALRRPPHGIFTKVSVVPDVKSQFKVVFEPLSQVPNDLMGVVMQRHKEAEASIAFPYTPPEEVPAPPVRGRTKPTPGKAAGKKKY